MRSRKKVGNRRVENTPFPSKESPKRSGANQLRSIYPSVTHSIWNGIVCHLENIVSRITRTQRNGSFIWSFRVVETFVTKMAQLKSHLATHSSSDLTNRIN